MPRKPKQEFTSAAQAVHSATTAKDPLGTLEIALVHFGAAALAPPLLEHILAPDTPPGVLPTLLNAFVGIGPSDADLARITAFMTALLDSDVDRATVLGLSLCAEGVPLDPAFAQRLPIQVRAALIQLMSMFVSELQTIDPVRAQRLRAGIQVLEGDGPISSLTLAALMAEHGMPPRQVRKPAPAAKPWPQLAKGLRRHYEIDLKLKGAKPAPWRRILLAADATWDDLHQAIQDASGTWYGGHLWCMHLGHSQQGELLTGSASDSWEPLPIRIAATSQLAAVIDREGQRKFLYLYDFGDDWEVTVTVRKVVDQPTREYRTLFAGELAFPPEDCGGIWGYYGMLEILKQPKHEEYESYMEWLGGDFDPEEFDIVYVNELLEEEDFGCIEL